LGEGPPDLAAPRPWQELPDRLERGDMNYALILQLTVQGILLGGIYGLIAVGLSLIFGVMGVVNFAHGPMIVLGMYITYGIFVLAGLDPYVSCVIASGALFLLGYLIQASIVNRILDFPEAMQVLPLVATGLIIENSVLMAFGPDPRSPRTALALASFNVGPISVDVSRFIAFLLALVMTGAIFIFLKKSDVGKRIRAAADSRVGAALVGIRVNKVNNFSFGLGAATTGAAGALLLPLMATSPHLGHDFTLTAFVVVILGGLGNLPGALAGGLILGVAESLATLFVPATMKQVVSFALLVGIMLVRPQGLFGGRR
jgi:branched-chain amino acid transport system permease protein